MNNLIYAIISMPFLAAAYLITCGFVYLLSLVFGFEFSYLVSAVVWAVAVAALTLTAIKRS